MNSASKTTAEKELVVFEEFDDYISFATARSQQTSDCFDVSAKQLVETYGKFLSRSTLNDMKRLIIDILEPRQSLDDEDLYNLCQACTKKDKKEVQGILDRYPRPKLDVVDYRQGFTPLSYAAAFGAEELIELLLDNGATVDFPSANGRTGLSCAANNGYDGVVKMLLEKGACVNTPTDTGWTPLNSAANNGHTIVVKLLLEHGADINQASRNGWTPLNSAADSGHLEPCKVLLEHGADVNTPNDEGFSPLNSAARKGVISIVKLLLESGAEIDQQSKEGWTALGSAVTNDHPDIVDLLLKKGADPNIQCNFGNCLHVAQGRLVDRLVRANCQIEAFSSEGFTPLHRFCHRTGGAGREETMMKKLIQHGADVNARTKSGLTPLHLACKSGVEERVKILLQAGSDPNAVSTKEKLTPVGFASSPVVEAELVGPDFAELMSFAVAGDVDEIRAKNPDPSMVNRGDKHMNSPLINAALHNQLATVELLVSLGADVKQTNATGHTAMVWAKWHNNEEMEQVLRDAGADATEGDLDGMKQREDWLNKNEDDRERMEELLLVTPESLKSLQNSAVRQMKDERQRGRLRGGLDTAGAEGSEGLGRRMQEVSHHQVCREFLPPGYKPDKSLLKYLQEDIGTQSWWMARGSNPEMEDMIWDGRKMVWWKCVEGDTVSPLHVFALFMYTYQSDACFNTNRVMREGDTDGIELWRPIIYYVEEGLKCLPPTSGRVLRGIRVPNLDVQQFKPGAELTWAAFSSTSLNYRVAVFFLREEKGVVFDIRDQKCGRLISPYSQFPMEEEVLLPPNQKLRVESLHDCEWRMLAMGDSASLEWSKARDKPRLVVVATVVE
eukprot:TRINITY_DN55964_c0_g1_i1.p1 TRINITY_DN55964_c0_g1~~TRINITY_DN55964_c0_g1_i1.p1  ORF type:complete len:857 (+),score=115.26 TRINITY_DN55964_c0_g1_i1:47-2572(+)